MESSIHFERSITIALLPVVNTNKDSVTAKKKTQTNKRETKKKGGWPNNKKKKKTWNPKCWICSISSTTTGKHNYQAGEGKIVLTLWQWAYFNCRSVCKSIIKHITRNGYQSKMALLTKAIQLSWYTCNELCHLSAWGVLQVLNNVKSDIFVFVFNKTDGVISHFTLQPVQTPVILNLLKQFTICCCCLPVKPGCLQYSGHLYFSFYKCLRLNFNKYIFPHTFKSNITSWDVLFQTDKDTKLESEDLRVPQMN